MFDAFIVFIAPFLPLLFSSLFRRCSYAHHPFAPPVFIVTIAPVVFIVFIGLIGHTVLVVPIVAIAPAITGHFLPLFSLVTFLPVSPLFMEFSSI
jgi:hypothetical protein